MDVIQQFLKNKNSIGTLSLLFHDYVTLTITKNSLRIKSYSFLTFSGDFPDNPLESLESPI